MNLFEIGQKVELEDGTTGKVSVIMITATNVLYQVNGLWWESSRLKGNTTTWDRMDLEPRI